MSPRLKEIEAKAMELPIDEREHLASQLFQSVHGQTLNEVDQAWLEIAEKRSSAYNSGKAKALSEEEFFEQIESELGWK